MRGLLTISSDSSAVDAVRLLIIIAVLQKQQQHHQGVDTHVPPESTIGNVAPGRSGTEAEQVRSGRDVVDAATEPMATGSPPATDISDTPPTPTTTTTTGDGNNSANTTTSTTTTSATSGTSSPTNTTTTTTSTATNTDAVVTTTTTATTTTNDDGSQVKNNNNTTINNNNNYHNGSPKAGTNDDQQHRDTQTPSDKVNVTSIHPSISSCISVSLSPIPIAAMTCFSRKKGEEEEEEEKAIDTVRKNVWQSVPAVPFSPPCFLPRGLPPPAFFFQSTTTTTTTTDGLGKL
ncbi:unnamed protein product [Notodromas monacha]|uniref:Uncharacterized protein n=1 Tax=Notodromas monacha TaxID=399045 RepID=A0A7R9GF25_9CRUS|nr:unnamed protein product [Notodromas monacha]CAG0918892.1 unnamed protein product [Notodromas monacha]